MARILLLYQLQTVDSEIDQTNQQMAEIAAQLGESEALQQARARYEAAQLRLRKAQAKMQDLDLEVKSLSDKITKQEKLLYSGKVLSAKEAANLQDEVSSLKRWRDDREEKLLEAMVEVEEVEAELEETQANLTATEANWSGGQAELKQTQAQLAENLANLKERRPAVAEKISPGDLQIYEQLRQQKAGRAVAAVKNGVCQGCGISPSNNKIRQARAGTELMYCSACGRILYVP